MKKTVPVFLILLLCLAFPAAAHAGSSVHLRFYDESGELEQTFTVKKGARFTMPWAANTKKATFMGWSLKPGETVNPKYTPDSIIRPDSSEKFYMVMFPNSSVSETYNEYSLIERLYTQPYDQVYMIGDSRFVHMSQHISEALGSSSLSAFTFISKGRQGLSWFTETARPTLLKKVKQQGSDARLAVVFNLGVNDLKHSAKTTVNVSKVAAKYIRVLKKLYTQLKDYNADLYLVSVNPFNSWTNALDKDISYCTRSFRQMRQFNALLKKSLSSRYTCVDTYSYLMKNGYSTRRGSEDDGLHFCSETSLAIFYQILDAFPKAVSSY